MREFFPVRAILLLGCAILTACGDLVPTKPRPFSGEIHELLAVEHAAGRYVAVGGISRTEDGVLVPDADRVLIVSSEDGTNWRRAELEPREGTLFDVAYGNGSFVAVGGRSIGLTGRQPIMLRSQDGVRWSPVESEAAIFWRSLVFGNGHFLALGLQSAAPRFAIARSVDGITWEEVAEANFWATGLAFGDGTFIVHGDAGTVGVSTDGESWSRVTIPLLNSVTDVSYLDGRFVASGHHDCCFGEIPEWIGYFTATSTDGSSWETASKSTRVAFFAQASGNGSYVATSLSALYTSGDLTSWNRTYDVEESQRWRTDVLFGGGRFVAVGREEIAISEDGRSWRSVAIPR